MEMGGGETDTEGNMKTMRVTETMREKETGRKMVTKK
jgi:hypothetical protein